MTGPNFYTEVGSVRKAKLVAGNPVLRAPSLLRRFRKSSAGLTDDLQKFIFKTLGRRRRQHVSAPPALLTIFGLCRLQSFAFCQGGLVHVLVTC